jgi:hypothetical protein
MVEISDFPHARARVRYPLTGFYGKAGILLFGVLAHSGEARDAKLANRLLS